MTGLVEAAPAKVNLCLFVGPVRETDGRHELVTVMQALTLHDRVELEPTGLGATADEVRCPGVPGAPADNLAAAALRAFRERAGWDGAPVRLAIEKRIPVAGGMAGGSADAAAALRLAARAAGGADERALREIAATLGADVPAQVRPGRWLATGAGERLRRLPNPPSYGILVLPSAAALSTADVYREADRQGLPRSAEDLAARLAEVDRVAHDLPAELLVNDLEPAARALCPQIDEALEAARRAGAEHVLLCGSGPTVVGFFREPEAARAAAVMLAGREPRPLAVEPWGARAA